MPEKKKHFTKIAIIGSKGLYSEYGGVERLVYQLCKELQRNSKYKITVFGNAKYREKHVPIISDIQTIEFQLPKLKVAGAGLLSFLSTFRACFMNNDIFYFNACGPGLFTFIPRLLGKKVIWHFHGFDYLRPRAALNKDFEDIGLWFKVKEFGRFLFLKTGEIFAVHFANMILVLGKSNLEKLSNYYPNQIHKFISISNFPSLENESNKTITNHNFFSLEKYLLSVSRLVPEKRIELLIRSFQELVPDFPDLSLVIVGEGEEKEHLRQIAASGPGNVIFTGAVIHSKMSLLYQKAKLFCLLSTIEGQSLSLLEAMSSECPVFASAIPETAEFGDELLFLTKGQNPEELSQELRRVLRDNKEMKKRSKIAKEYVLNNFSAAKTTKIIESVFEQFT